MPGDIFVCCVTKVTIVAPDNTSTETGLPSILSQKTLILSVLTMAEETGGKGAMFLPKRPQKTL